MSPAGDEGDRRGAKRARPAGAGAWSRVRDSRVFLQEVWKRGEPDLQPDTGCIVLPRTAGMAALEKQFYGRALFLNIVGEKHVTAADVLVAMEVYCGVRQSAARVEVTCPPYHFFVRFDSAEDCTRVVDLYPEIRCYGARVTIRRWSYSARGMPGKMEYNTVLSMEGLPEEAWEPEAVNLVMAGLGGHLVEILPAKDGWVLPVKAWLGNPSTIPKELTVKVPVPVLLPTQQDSDEEGESSPPPSSPTRKGTHEYKLIMHVKEVIDRGHLLTDGMPDCFLPNEGEDLSRKHVFKTWRGKVDGTGEGNQGEA